jgi:hypothetical protein
MAGTPKVKDWLANPAFGIWFSDQEHYGSLALAYSEIALEKLYDILSTPLDPSDRTVTARDQISAAKEILLLADRYPTKRKEVRFLDKDLDKLPDHEVESTLAEYKAALAPRS